MLGFLIMQTQWSTPAVEEHRNAVSMAISNFEHDGEKNSTEVSEPWLLSMVNAFGLTENSLESKSVT